MNSRTFSQHAIARVIILTSCLLLAFGCNKNSGEGVESASDVESIPFKTSYKTETEFILTSILTRFGSLCYQATGNRNPATCKVEIKRLKGENPFQPKFEIGFTPHGQKKPVKETIQITKPIWDPENYKVMFSKISESYPLSLTDKPAGTNTFLRQLLDFNAGSLQKENLRIGAELTTNFFSATLHREAAVLIGTLALKDFARQFFDIRSELCEMTARIAFANLLTEKSNSPDSLKILADSLLYTGMNHQTGALERIQRIPDTEPLVRWKRGLVARVTGDYRPLEKETRTVMEDVMYFYACSQSVSPAQAWPQIKQGRLDRNPDFYRIAHHFGPTVQLGHELMENALRLHKLEEQEVKGSFESIPPNFEKMLPDFCFESAAGKMLEPLSPGLWNYFLQRQLCHSISKIWNFQQKSWGVHEEARSYRQEMEKQFGHLRLFPYVARITSLTEEDYATSMKGALPVFLEGAGHVPPEARNFLYSLPKFAASRHLSLDLEQYLKEGLLPGTAFCPRGIYQRNLNPEGDYFAKMWEAAQAIAPYDSEVVQNHLKILGEGNPTYEQLQLVYSPVLDYSVHAMETVAGRATNNPARYEELLTKAAEANPSIYFHLGHFFSRREDEAKTLKYYELAVEKGTDAVALANQVNWLVMYYHRNGEAGKAEKLANNAAEAYSFDGLGTRSDLYEVQGRWMDALRYQKMMEERYNQSDYLLNFIFRYKAATGKADLDHELRKREKEVKKLEIEIFPQGQSKVTLTSFTKPPVAGVEFLGDSSEMNKVGLKKGDIIVSSYGIRTDYQRQFAYLRDSVSRPDLELIVWDGEKYLEVKAHPPGKKFGVGIQDYQRPKKARSIK